MSKNFIYWVVLYPWVPDGSHSHVSNNGSRSGPFCCLSTADAAAAAALSNPNIAQAVIKTETIEEPDKDEEE
jgi:hypothetical protein